MKLLIDTHTFLWFVLDSPQLSTAAKGLIEDEDNQILISIASLWELTIKTSLGKLDIPVSLERFLPAQLTVNRIVILPIEVSHLHRLVHLPLHHRDPFDRLLIAQSMEENIPIISRDSSFSAYPIQAIWNA